MKDITSKVSSSEMDNARIDRSIANNPVDVEPGMDDFDWDDDIGGDTGGGFGEPLDGPFGGGGGFGGGGFGETNGFGDSFGSSGGFDGGFGQPTTQKKSAEDTFWEGLIKTFKGTMSFSSEFIASFKTFDTPTKLSTGRTVIIAGLSTTVAGILLLLLHFGGTLGLSMVVGGLISTGLGIPLFMFAYEDLSNGVGVPQPEPEPEFNASSSFGDDDEFSLFGDDDDEYEEEDDFIEIEEDEDLDFGAFTEPEPVAVEEPVGDKKDVLNSVIENVDIPNGMVTRQYLYDTISVCLEHANKDYAKMRVIEDDTDEFNAWDAIIQNSSGLFKPKGDDVEMPYLISAKDSLFYVMLEVNRVKWLKNIDIFVNEIVDIYRFDEDNGKMDSSIYGVGTTVGNKIYIKIMKGESAMVTIKDLYKSVEDKVKDSANMIPVVIGVDSEGQAVFKDFKSVNAILVTGMPRSGKTWTVLSIIAQMACYMKPSELNFHILDPKDQVSDFKSLDIPHIRKFVSSDKAIIDELRHIVRVEGVRRKKIIGDAGFVNIFDYKKKNPDVDLPLLYVVIDEVITLAERMDKEVKDEFQGLLLELVSQLPALGIRIFMIPHVVKDQVLKKSITDLIPCRISVRGDADHVEKSVGTKGFKHKLTNQGDMAVRFDNDAVLFVHSAILAKSNEGNQEFFEFLRKLWLKIEPESKKGSLLEYNERQEQIKSVGTTPKSNITMDVNTQEKPKFIKKPEMVLSDTDSSDILNSFHNGGFDDFPDFGNTQSSNKKDTSFDDEELDLWRE